MNLRIGLRLRTAGGSGSQVISQLPPSHGHWKVAV
jgi:hypothetical protein